MMLPSAKLTAAPILRVTVAVASASRLLNSFTFTSFSMCGGSSATRRWSGAPCLDQARTLGSYIGVVGGACWGITARGQLFVSKGGRRHNADPEGDLRDPSGRAGPSTLSSGPSASMKALPVSSTVTHSRVVPHRDLD
jgi:hypothetical protein